MISLHQALPTCRDRGVEILPGHFVCLSSRPTPTVANIRDCLTCPHVARMSIGSLADLARLNAAKRAACEENKRQGLPCPDDPATQAQAALPPESRPKRQALAKCRAVVINLDRRQDRWRLFDAATAAMGTPLFDRIVRVSAVDGTIGKPPGNWRGGPGAWGCRQSHLRVLESALADGIEMLTVFEDDCIFAPDFTRRLTAFLAAVSQSWDGIMLGGQHQVAAPIIAPGIRRVLNAQRTHAYIVRGREGMEELHALWFKAETHIDHCFYEWQSTHQVYAPDPWLCGQNGGLSDIRRRNERPRFWDDWTERVDRRAS